MNGALAGLEVDGGQEVEERRKAVRVHEPRHEGVGLRPEGDLQAVNLTGPGSNLVRVIRKLELKRKMEKLKQAEANEINAPSIEKS